MGASPLMPLMVVEVCSTYGEQLPRDVCWLQTPASDVPDLLHLAVNSQKPEAAQGLLQLMQDEYTAEPAYLMQQLLSFHHQKEQEYEHRVILQQLQAYQRRGWSLPPILQQHKGQQQAMQQAWDAIQQRHQQEQQQLRDRPQQLKQLLTTDLVVELLRTAALRSHWAVMGGLFDLDAAQFVTADVAAELLHAAVQARSSVGLDTLIRQQAAKKVSADALCSLMQSALQTAFQGAYSRLLQLPAVTAFNAADALQLLRQGIQMRDAVAVHNICKLSIASALTAEEVVTLMQHGLARSISEVFADLTELPGALLIPTGSMVVLLQTAMQQADILAVEDLMKMDAADQLDAQQLGQLCKIAMALRTDSACVELLLQLSAADDLDESQVDELVEAALQQSKRNPCYGRSSFNSLKAVLQTPAAHNLRLSLIYECLEQLVHVPGSDDLIDLLCGLENAHAIEYSVFGSNNGSNSVILTALQLHRVAAANSMSELTYFNDVSTEVLQELLSAAIQYKQEELAVKLCDGGAVQKLPPSSVLRMLHVATRQRLCKVVGSLLLVLNAGADMRTDQLVDLIKEELNAVGSCTQHPVSCILNEYLAHDVAAPMHWSQIADLMRIAIQKRKDRAIAHLCKLSGAQDANAWQLVDSVLHVGLECGDAWLEPSPADSFMATVCQLPAAHHMNAPVLKSLMEAAVRGGGTQSLLQLCQLPAAVELGAADVVELVVIAMHYRAAGVTAVLSTLPGAALTTRQDLMLMLQTAIATEDVCSLAILGCEVNDSVLTRFGSSKFGAAEKLVAEDVAALLLMCLQDQESSQAAEHIEALSKLPAAKHLTSDQLSSLLQTAVKLALGFAFAPELHKLCVLHEKVLGPMSDDLICKLVDIVDTSMPGAALGRVEVLEILSDFHKQQQLSGVVCGLH